MTRVPDAGSVLLQIGVSAAFLAAAALYAAPSLAAVLKGHRRWLTVVLVNILLGWTIVGWLAAWAFALEIKLTPSRRTNSAPTRPTVPADHHPPPPRRSSDEPPKVREDIYAEWLDRGGADDLVAAPVANARPPMNRNDAPPLSPNAADDTGVVLRVSVPEGKRTR